MELTRVVVRTVDRRGKSLMPLSRIAIEESRREREERRDATEAEREAADEVDIVVVVLLKVDCIRRAVDERRAGIREVLFTRHVMRRGAFVR
jgi:hypothetical protein